MATTHKIMNRPTPLQAIFDEVIARLIELRNGGTVQCWSLHEDDPESLEMLHDLAKDSARTMDAIFHEIAYQGGFGSRSGASEYANIVTNAIAGNLEFELRNRAEEIRDECGPHIDPNSEHKIGCHEAGVGRR